MSLHTFSFLHYNFVLSAQKNLLLNTSSLHLNISPIALKQLVILPSNIGTAQRSIKSYDLAPKKNCYCMVKELLLHGKRIAIAP